MYRMRALATSAAMATPIPDSSSQTVVPDLSSGGVPQEDRDELAEQFLAALNNPEPDPISSYTFLGRLVRHHMDGAPRRGTLTEDSEGLGRELLLGAGLLVDRSAGKRMTLPDTTLAALQREARSLVESVRSWKPEIDTLKSVAVLLSSDPRVSWPRDLDPANLLRQLEATKAEHRKRATERALESRVGWETLRLRFPFLMPSELEMLRDRDETQATETLRDRLLLERCPSEITVSRLKAIVSESKA